MSEVTCMYAILKCPRNRTIQNGTWSRWPMWWYEKGWSMDGGIKTTAGSSLPVVSLALCLVAVRCLLLMPVPRKNREIFLNTYIILVETLGEIRRSCCFNLSFPLCYLICMPKTGHNTRSESDRGNRAKIIEKSQIIQSSTIIKQTFDIRWMVIPSVVEVVVVEA